MADKGVNHNINTIFHFAIQTMNPARFGGGLFAEVDEQVAQLN